MPGAGSDKKQYHGASMVKIVIIEPGISNVQIAVSEMLSQECT